MKVSWYVLILFAISLNISILTTSKASVVADGAQVTRIASGYSFTEGPAVDAVGNVFFTDQPNNKIMKLSPEGTLSVFLSPCGRANGLFFDRDGNLWACADEKNELWKIDPNGTVTIVVKNFQGKLLNGPNDAWVSRTNGLYFTDPLYNRNYWTHRGGQSLVSGQHVYYLKPDMETLVQVTNDLQQPNGIIGTPDGRYLFVADYGGNKTYRYTIQPDGTLGDKILFCEQGSDGMTIDKEGNIYLTRTGVTVYNRYGEKVETINVPEGTTNVTFGGPDGKTLYITGGGSLYSLRMNVQGSALIPNFNADEIVNFLDYANLAKSWKQDDPNLDLGPTSLGDGIIDMCDLAILTGNWLEEIFPMELKAYWRLDEPNGPVAFDSAGTNDAAVMGDMLWMPDSGKVDGALQFDGLDDYINTPFVIDPSLGPLSIFVWAKGGAPGQVILSQAGNKDILSTDSQGNLITELKPSGRGSKGLYSETLITDDNWHHIGFVWDGLRRTLYVDGEIAAQDDSDQVVLYGSISGLYIGAGMSLDSGTFWSGLIDDIRVYNSAIVPQ